MLQSNFRELSRDACHALGSTDIDTFQLTGSKTHGAFAMGPHDGQPVFVAQLNGLDQLNGKSLAAHLRVFAAQGMAGIEAVRDHVA